MGVINEEEEGRWGSSKFDHSLMDNGRPDLEDMEGYPKEEDDLGRAEDTIQDKDFTEYQPYKPYDQYAQGEQQEAPDNQIDEPREAIYEPDEPQEAPAESEHQEEEEKQPSTTQPFEIKEVNERDQTVRPQEETKFGVEYDTATLEKIPTPDNADLEPYMTREEKEPVEEPSSSEPRDTTPGITEYRKTTEAGPNFSANMWTFNASDADNPAATPSSAEPNSGVLSEPKPVSESDMRSPIPEEVTNSEEHGTFAEYENYEKEPTPSKEETISIRDSLRE